MVANGRFAMRPGITLRRDYDAARLRRLARTTKSAAETFRQRAEARRLSWRGDGLAEGGMKAALVGRRLSFSQRPRRGINAGAARFSRRPPGRQRRPGSRSA